MFEPGDRVTLDPRGAAEERKQRHPQRRAQHVAARSVVGDHLEDAAEPQHARKLRRLKHVRALELQHVLESIWISSALEFR